MTFQPQTSLISRLAAVIGGWRSRWEQRQLAELSPHLLRDLGLDPMQVAFEQGRFLWPAESAEPAAPAAAPAGPSRSFEAALRRAGRLPAAIFPCHA